MEEKKNISKSDTYDETHVAKEVIMEIPISAIKDFPNHPYKVKDDDGMNELVESIKTRGLIQPILVRPIEDGKYEMVSGHRRKRAFEIAGIEKYLHEFKNLQGMRRYLQWLIVICKEKKFYFLKKHLHIKCDLMP